MFLTQLTHYIGIYKNKMLNRDNMNVCNCLKQKIGK